MICLNSSTTPLTKPDIVQTLVRYISRDLLRVRSLYPGLAALMPNISASLRQTRLLLAPFSAFQRPSSDRRSGCYFRHLQAVIKRRSFARCHPHKVAARGDAEGLSSTRCISEAASNMPCSRAQHCLVFDHDLNAGGAVARPVPQTQEAVSTRALIWTTCLSSSTHTLTQAI